MALAVGLLAFGSGLAGDASPARLDVRESVIAPGWARNSVNAVIFRTHSVTSHGDQQYASFYDQDGQVILARRTLGTSEWEIHPTGFTGNTRDAHNAICIGVDGDGLIHLSWDHHNHPLKYRRSLEPHSFPFSDALPMTGAFENRVTYPEFFNTPDGGFIFSYRHGGSGRGNILLNRYDPATREWRPLQHPLIDGEGERNAYTNQIAIDHRGHLHLSWTWRDTSDVATNHNLLYATSPDGGHTWFRSNGEPYSLPINYANGEVVVEIPRNSELINQCSMTVDTRGRPIIASYWWPKGADAPQYHVAWFDGSRWRVSQVGQRTEPFRLSGGGTRRIPISRPQVAVDREDRVFLLFRDQERGSRISVAWTDDPERQDWRIVDLTEESVGMWEPTYDLALWRREGVFHIFKQFVGQGQSETLEEIDAQMVSILEWDPRSLR
jgi:hypothetical protein